ncbi:MAG: sporulation peptidase YabG [Clostridia bacterium]|nr:sporulation peptidase YabG [Clostridia bacterium]
MAGLAVGDVVGRRSYGCDIFFRICGCFRKQGRIWARLKGLDYRLQATAVWEDLVKIKAEQLSCYLLDLAQRTLEQEKKLFRRRQLPGLRGESTESFGRVGFLLHLDGDPEYLDLCLTVYRQLGIPCCGYHVEESQQCQRLPELLKRHQPEMLVLTGHDGLIRKAGDLRKVENYHNSAAFVSAVQAARQYEKNLDSLVIFAGACQSHYESLLQAGANFASSPQRVLIHAYDPVFVMEKVAFTSISQAVALPELLAGTVTGLAGVGGVETRGKYRLGLPRSPYF